ENMNPDWSLLLDVLFSTECKGEEKVTQPPGDVILTQGQTATLNCTFTATDYNPALFWYKQEVNSYPKFILTRSRSSADNSPEFVKDRFDAELKDSSVPLRIQDLHVSDSAVYYCALRPTNSSKMTDSGHITI
uniref:Ig-like domain-containing protein n=1 Tax=Gouania willdenowi TaxID=441366 RepID=A0A8C5GP89_GOUWI